MVLNAKWPTTDRPHCRDGNGNIVVVLVGHFRGIRE